MGLWQLISALATNARCAALNGRSSRHKMKNAVAFGFRQRHGGGRCVPTPFQPSLRLHFTFPLAESLTEACGWHRSFLTWLWMKRVLFLSEILHTFCDNS